MTRVEWQLPEDDPVQSGLAEPPETSSPKPANFTDFATELGFPAWMGKIFAARSELWQTPDPDSLRRFLQPSLKDMPQPFLLADMEKAANRVCAAILEQEMIAVYGDYDVDGTVGTAVLRRFLRSVGVEPIVYQPDRKLEGYGLNVGAIERFATKGVTLMLSVDCGISNVKEAEAAKNLGLDLIIVDHHEVPEPMPQAFAVLDHKRPDDVSGINNLCGAGMAFYLAMAVRARLREQKFFTIERPEPDLRELLDLVAVATIADMVPLIQENRILARLGLEKLRRQPTPGLAALFAVAGVDHRLAGAYHVGFVIGPRINASGRLGSASKALELLSTDNLQEARELAQALEEVNAERVAIQNRTVGEALAQAESLVADWGADFPALVLGSDGWHEGVIGIVAAKVVDKFHRPVVVCSFSEDAPLGKASVRGFQDLNALAALQANAHLLAKFGGHKAAAGLSIARENFAAFQQGFAAAIQEQVEARLGKGQKLMPRRIRVDSVLSAADISVRSARALEALAPFGMGNPEPVVVLENLEVVSKKVLKSAHLKLQVQASALAPVEAMWFNAGDLPIDRGSQISLACTPQLSTFRGITKLELRVRDLRPQ